MTDHHDRALRIANKLPVGDPLRRSIISALVRIGKFPKGVSMTVDEVVGPDFKEMNENPPEEVQGKTAFAKKSYFTLMLPPGDSRWHSPTKTLSRGAFKSTREAVAWANKNIPGYDYTIKEFADPEAVEQAFIGILKALNDAGDRGVRAAGFLSEGIAAAVEAGLVISRGSTLHANQPAFDEWVSDPDNRAWTSRF